MADDQIEELREKLEAQQLQFDNYKEECKQLEEFLEEEAQKKQDEIKKLQQDAIKKEKSFNLMKLQVSQLESENKNLKSELKEKESGDFGQELEMLRNENEGLKKKVQEFAGSSLKLSLSQEQVKRQEEEIKGLKQRLEEKRDHNDSIEKSQLIVEVEKPGRQEDLRKAEEKIIQLEKIAREMKSKNSYLLIENEQLLRQINKRGQNRNKDQNIKQQLEEQISVTPTQTTSALILTKKHYISPFLELRNDNSIKVYKSLKIGYEKSLGAIKYKLNKITYDTERLVNQTVENVKLNLSKGIKNNAIFIFGVKKSSKKYLMANIVEKLKQFILSRVEENRDHEAVFIKASSEPQKRMNVRGCNLEEIQSIFNTIIEMGIKSPKKADPLAKKKPPSMPKIRYFRVIIQDEILQIITSSHTNLPIRSGSTIIEALNQICYSKLPNILPSADSHRQYIFTLNPIVNYYEDCKVTLSLANCPLYPLVHSPSKNIQSPIKQSLHEVARRKFESIQKESELNTARTKRLEEEIAFYRVKFDELEVRLKNLLNTHNEHSSYLKKSPVISSYGKMLRFIHNVQSRNQWYSRSSTHEDYSGYETN